MVDVLITSQMIKWCNRTHHTGILTPKTGNEIAEIKAEYRKQRFGFFLALILHRMQEYSIS